MDPNRRDEPFEWITLFPDRVLETIEPMACRQAMVEALDRDRPDAVVCRRLFASGIDGRGTMGPPARAAVDPDVREPGDRPSARLVERADQEAAGATVRRRPGRRAAGTAITWCSSGCLATESPWATTRSTTPTSRPEPTSSREDPDGRTGLPAAPYFLTVCRFVPDKNLVRLIGAFARYRRQSDAGQAWDLVLCGDGPGAGEVEHAIERERLRAGHPPARVSPGRPFVAMVRSCRGVRAAEFDGALGTGRQRGRRLRLAAVGLVARRLRSDAGAGAARNDRLPIRSAGCRGDFDPVGLDGDLSGR